MSKENESKKGDIYNKSYSKGKKDIYNKWIEFMNEINGYVYFLDYVEKLSPTNLKCFNQGQID